ncbi:hypothetical protein [Pseudomonas sp. Leaf129]|uniref:hypothetical protein n=1 Tax=Pseudomonas sp. Leaf129 TaxID=1736268 RepID=UPI000AFE4EDB|nr:hypothetical protein [Pseudomonas sp. Leaf129]
MRAPKITVSLILLVLSQFSFADMLVSDEASFKQKYFDNFNRTVESAKNMVVNAAQLKAIGDTAQMGVDAINNGFANTTARLDKGKEERQNLEHLERVQPAKDACDTLAVSVGLNDAECAEADQIDRKATERAARYSAATGGGMMNKGEEVSVQDINSVNTKIAAEIIDKCAKLDGKCQDPKLWLTSSALTADEYRALQLQNDLAAGSQIAVPHVTSLLPGSPEYAHAVVEDVRIENAREQARSSLEAIQIAQHGTITGSGTRAPGRVELYDDFDDKHIGSKEWICAVTNSCTDNYVPPAEAQRRAAELKAVATSLALDQYKSDLRREALLQSALLNEVNKAAPTIREVTQ